MKNHLFALLTFLLLLGQPCLGENEAKHLKVAALLGLTGDAAYHSSGIRKGIELAAEDLKKLGWQIDLRFEDDQTNSTKTVSAMQFLHAEGYNFFIGPTWDFQVNAVRQIVSKSNIVALVPAGSSDINGGGTEGIFNLCSAKIQQVPYLVEWLKTTPYRRGFIITPNGDWGEVHRQVFSQALKDSSGQVLREEQFDYGIDMASIRTILLKAKQEKADVVFVTGAGADVANIVRARNSLNLNFAILSTSDIRDALALRLLSAEDLQRDVFAIVLAVKSASDFRARFETRFGEAPGLYSDRGYDALMVLAHASERTDGSPELIRKYLSSNFDYAGASGQIAFDKQGDVRTGQYQIVKAAM